MRKLAGLIGVLAALALLAEGGDIGARHYATSKIDERIIALVPDTKGVHSWIHGWPFLQVAVDGEVDEIGATAASLVVAPLQFVDIRVVLDGVRIDRSELISGGKVEVTSIGSGSIAFSVTDASLVRAFLQELPGAEAAVGRIPSDLSGVHITVDQASRRLVVTVAGVPALELPLPPSNLLPCTPGVALVGDSVRLSCQFSRVPTAFSAAAS